MNFIKNKVPNKLGTLFSGSGFVESDYLHPHPQFESKSKIKIVSQSMLMPPFIQPQPQFCKSKSKKMSEQQSNPPRQSSITSPQFEPPKKFICAS